MLIPHWLVHALLLAVAVLLGIRIGLAGQGRPRIPRENLERVLDLVGPAIVDGKCLGCGGRLEATSPPFLPHRPFCPEVDRLKQARELLGL